MLVESDRMASIEFFSEGTQVICQSSFLRSLGAGQVDYAYCENGRLYIVEAKSRLGVKQSQVLRLRNSARILSNLLNIDVEIILYVSKEKKIHRI